MNDHHYGENDGGDDDLNDGDDDADDDDGDLDGKDSVAAFLWSSLLRNRKLILSLSFGLP